ncbi:hypothetical protein IVW58_28530 [Salmonella enterica subsp. enterica serovar Worthington]|nr:hypothetical protein [Salmonella enterica subsp. enterica serovar Worthington]
MELPDNVLRASGGWYPRGRHLDWSNDMTMRGGLYRKVNVRELLLNTVSRIERKSLIRFDQKVGGQVISFTSGDTLI